MGFRPVKVDLLCIDVKVTPGTLHAIGGTFYSRYVSEA